MTIYHKINSIFKRGADKKFLMGQYSQPEFAYLANNTWDFYEKIDGTNIRIIVGNGDVVFGGRTDNAQLPAPLFKRLQELFLPKKDTLLTMFPDGACLYGEGYGAGIQKGGNYKAEQDFVLFDVLVNNWWLQRPNVEHLAKDLALDIVPLVGQGTLNDGITLVKELQSIWGPFTAEGVIAHPHVPLLTRHGSRIITKIKHKDFT